MERGIALRTLGHVLVTSCRIRLVFVRPLAELTTCSAAQRSSSEGRAELQRGTRRRVESRVTALRPHGFRRSEQWGKAIS